MSILRFFPECLHIIFIVIHVIINFISFNKKSSILFSIELTSKFNKSQTLILSLKTTSCKFTVFLPIIEIFSKEFFNSFTKYSI
ncbi:hypothetical protein A0H76_1198 [Hepatospora eriocheir]|uniref:Uncharacterized protein n=1 Tax=Hepatospora eriocheir TaxID=1081669 RepID=A0A1X0Q605_9MICR|nr:hypothetical protein A0H76_1198 [Hepatospora eriocheir]